MNLEASLYESLIPLIDNGMSQLLDEEKEITVIKQRAVYVGGAYSADNVIDILGNMRRGIELAGQVMNHGHAAFAPWLDYQIILVSNYHFNVSVMQKASMTWLSRSDCMLLVRQGVGKSQGTQAEIRFAQRNDIPVYDWLDEMLHAFEEEDSHSRCQGAIPDGTGLSQCEVKVPLGQELCIECAANRAFRDEEDLIAQARRAEVSHEPGMPQLKEPKTLEEAAANSIMNLNYTCKMCGAIVLRTSGPPPPGPILCTSCKAKAVSELCFTEPIECCVLCGSTVDSSDSQLCDNCFQSE